MPSLWIIDSGSTKTDVACLKSGHLILRKHYQAYNAHQHDTQRIRDMHVALLKDNDQEVPDRIIHYCSGATPDRQGDITGIWKALSPRAEVEVYSDVYALAHILQEPGWLAILGTGSNLSRFDGHVVMSEVKSLGWLLGDEGSSRDIARELIRQYCRKMLQGDAPVKLRELLGLKPENVIPELQDQSRLLSTIDKITLKLDELGQLNSVKDVIHHRIQCFFDLMPITRMRGSKIIFTGGVACNHSDFIEDFLNSHQIEHQFIRFPIDALIDHYAKRDQ